MRHNFVDIFKEFKDSFPKRDTKLHGLAVEHLATWFLSVKTCFSEEKWQNLHLQINHKGGVRWQKIFLITQ